MLTPIKYTLIETADGLKKFHEENKSVEWLAFDSEFVGERRFSTLICLIQVATSNGYYLLDPFKLSDLKPFLALIEDPKIMKITHAGENDYRLLYSDFGVLPGNIFDTQIAAGFLGHGYPVSYSKLVERELSVKLDKRFAVTDWEARPFNKRQLEYALNDVHYLPQLYRQLQNRLEAQGRATWAKSEMSKMEKKAYFDRDPDKEALSSTLMYGLKTKKQVFLLRLYRWRRDEAKAKNYSKEMILPAKLIAPIVRNVDTGKESLLENRTISSKTIETHWETFFDLYNRKANPEELETLERLPQSVTEDPLRELSVDLLHLIVKFKCHESGVSPALVLNKSDITYALPGEDLFGNDEEPEWQKEFLGESLLKWLHERPSLDVNIEKDRIVVTKN